jgi:CRP-like cAMP-binding protein
LQIDYRHPNGTQTIFSLCEPLATVGDLELLESFPAVRNVFVLQTSTLLAASSDIIRNLGAEDFRFLRFILHQIVKKLDFSSNQLTQSALPLKSRLARYLLMKMNCQGFVFELEKREVLAVILGTSVRHLNRTLKALSEAKIIEVHYQSLEIINLEKLSAVVEAPFRNRT